MAQKPKPLDDSLSMAHWFGMEVRNWRRVRGMSAADLGGKVHLSGSSIEKIEKAERSCNTDLARALDEALDAGGALLRLWRRVKADADKKRADTDNSMTPYGWTDAALAGAGKLLLAPHSATPSDGSLSAMERRAFLAAGGVAALIPGSFADLDPQLVRTSLPKTVRLDHIEQVRSASTFLARWDNSYGGGGMVRVAAIGLLNWATELLEVPCPEKLEADLFSAVGRLAVVMGASAFDAYEHENARRYLQIGAACAEHAENWHLRAIALNWRARQEIWVGRADEGLTHAENGLVRADRLTPRAQAMLHNARARALAKMGRVQETLSAVGRSDDAFARAETGELVAWMAYYDNAQHHGDTGHALFDTVILADHTPRPAVRRLQTAIREHKDAYVRSRALSGTKLASLTLATGDPREAVTIGHRALDEVGQLSSKRAIDDVRELSHIATKHARIPEVAELRDRIRAVLS
ncbi:helix-turn-helix transcriptional regulator [Streptomyces sp. NPDC001840]